jgi:type IV secretion system protein VirB2
MAKVIILLEAISVSMGGKCRFFWNCLSGLLAMLLASPAHAQIAADPQGSGVILGAANWLQGTLLGTVATVAAVLAVASVGFMMLTGRINWRHGAVVILGCFILFGAASIVAGIRAAASLG